MKTFDEDNFKMHVHENALVEFLIKKDCRLTENDIWLSRNLSMNYLPGKKFFVLTEAEGAFNPTPGARSAGASKEYSKHVSALALCSNQTVLKILGNLFVQINKPAVKTKFFDDRDKALTWLNQQMQVNI
ncbi:MAG: hypothetical protein IPM51_04430 [Sphingobacteriaceae bacterium]|nr:hypothetical protein [Sphingobacteriaceae bacterium]